jgi:hypothetical protein
LFRRAGRRARYRRCQSEMRGFCVPQDLPGRAVVRAWRAWRKRPGVIPSGRCLLLPGLGMNTRLTGSALNGSRECATLSTSSVLAFGVSTTSPFTPAVRRRALRSVTRRTLNSVLARDRSINDSNRRTPDRFPRLRCREDPLPQPPYVLLGLTPVDLTPVGLETIDPPVLRRDGAGLVYVVSPLAPRARSRRRPVRRPAVRTR